jgi:hypothetical protein
MAALHRQTGGTQPSTIPPVIAVVHDGLAPILILLLGFDQGSGRKAAFPETTKLRSESAVAGRVLS